MNKIGFAYDEVTSFMQTMTGAVLIRSQSHCYQHVACLTDTAVFEIPSNHDLNSRKK